MSQIGAHALLLVLAGRRGGAGLPAGYLLAEQVASSSRRWAQGGLPACLEMPGNTRGLIANQASRLTCHIYARLCDKRTKGGIKRITRHITRHNNYGTQKGRMRSIVTSRFPGMSAL